MSILHDLFHWFSRIEPCDDKHFTMTVKQGQSLWLLAEAYTGNGERWRELAKANPDRHWDKDYTLQVDETLKIPHDWATD